MRSLPAAVPSCCGTFENILVITGQIAVHVVKMKFIMTGSSAASNSRNRTGFAF